MELFTHTMHKKGSLPLSALLSPDNVTEFFKKKLVKKNYGRIFVRLKIYWVYDS